MFKELPLWADALIRTIAILLLLGGMLFLAIILTSCSSEESYYDVSDWKYIGSATFSHLEYKPINLQSYTIYYMENGKCYVVIGIKDGFEKGQLVHIYQKWESGRYSYKFFEDPIHKVRGER